MFSDYTGKRQLIVEATRIKPNYNVSKLVLELELSKVSMTKLNDKL